MRQRKSLRLKNHSYSEAGYYFVTLCTVDQRPYFENERLRATAEQRWIEIPRRFADVEVDVHVIMPNHLHGILILTCSARTEVGDCSGNSVGAVQEPPEEKAIRELPLPSSAVRRRMLLSRMIGWFKMNSAKQANLMLDSKGEPFWQRSFYDHVIRNDRELFNVRKYIVENPLRWNLDAENPAFRKDRTRIDIDKYYRNIFDASRPDNS